MTQRSASIVAASLLAIAGCGGGGGGDDAGSDAPVPVIDANRASDALPGTPDAEGPLTCGSYCGRMSTTCTGGNAQYASDADCMATCALWEVGELDMTRGNTLGCRIWHVGIAEVAPDIHCEHAGPGGGDLCGFYCPVFCTLDMTVCTGANEIYSGHPQCMQACNGFAKLPLYDASQTTGDTYACRLYHATAATTDPDLHCASTAVVSAACN
jgi:hypothetical protein